MLAVWLILFTAAPVTAQQYDIPGASGAVQITMTPVQATPGGTARLTLKSPIFDLENSLISWRVDGELISEGEGVVTVSVQLGAAGETTEVTASVIHGGDDALASVSITPASLDLMWEGDGLSPGFYRGRTLTGVGAKITFVAYPTFVRDGQRIPEKDLIYTWRRGESILGSLSGRGKSSMSIQDSLLSSEVISVEARTADGTISAQASTRLPAPRTQLRLYHEHPLFGTLFHQALGQNTFTSDNEMTFQAIPYFAPAKTANDPALDYGWHVNQTDIAADAKKPSQITINAEHSSGIALIELDVGHKSDYFFGERAAWHVTFSSANGGVSNPFAPTQ